MKPFYMLFILTLPAIVITSCGSESSRSDLNADQSTDQFLDALKTKLSRKSVELRVQEFPKLNGGRGPNEASIKNLQASQSLEMFLEEGMESALYRYLDKSKDERHKVVVTIGDKFQVVVRTVARSNYQVDITLGNDDFSTPKATVSDYDQILKAFTKVLIDSAFDNPLITFQVQGGLPKDGFKFITTELLSGIYPGLNKHDIKRISFHGGSISAILPDQTNITSKGYVLVGLDMPEEHFKNVFSSIRDSASKKWLFLKK